MQTHYFCRDLKLLWMQNADVHIMWRLETRNNCQRLNWNGLHNFLGEFWQSGFGTEVHHIFSYLICALAASCYRWILATTWKEFKVRRSRARVAAVTRDSGQGWTFVLTTSKMWHLYTLMRRCGNMCGHWLISSTMKLWLCIQCSDVSQMSTFDTIITRVFQKWHLIFNMIKYNTIFILGC